MSKSYTYVKCEDCARRGTNVFSCGIDFGGVTTPAIYPRDNVAERYDVSEFFIKFPRSLTIEMKGVAV